MRSRIILLALAFGCVLAAHAESARVIKVLPHLLDLKGRDAKSPSLFERDAYQVYLREHKTNRSALRFDVQWTGNGHRELTLRVEAKGGTGRQPQTKVLERKVAPGSFSTWTALTISGDDYKQFGDLISWRATLWSGTNQVAEQRSFLW